MCYLVAALVLGVLSVVPVAAQQSRVYREGTSWVQETTGTLPGSVNLSVRLGFGSVNVMGTSNSNISYSFKLRARGEEASARRQFEQQKVDLCFGNLL